MEGSSVNLGQSNCITAIVRLQRGFKSQFCPYLNAKELARLSSTCREAFSGVFNELVRGVPNGQLHTVLNGRLWQALVQRDYPWIYQIYEPTIQHSNQWGHLSHALSTKPHWVYGKITPDATDEDCAPILDDLQQIFPQGAVLERESCTAHLFNRGIVARGYSDGTITLVYSNHVPQAVLKTESPVLDIIEPSDGNRFWSLHADYSVRDWSIALGEFPARPIQPPPRISRCQQIMEKIKAYRVSVIIGIAIVALGSPFLTRR